MKIKTLKLSLFLLVITTVFISCNDDDDGVAIFAEEDRTEQQEIDNQIILDYLASHYYNSGFFTSGADHEYSDIIISELPQDDEGNYLDMPDPANNTLLINAVETRTATYLETDYQYYVLNINQGGGDSPKFTDFLRVKYEGSSINEEVGGEEDVFDSATTPAEINLQTDFFNTQGAIKAWQLVLPTFNTSTGYGINEFGDVSFYDAGLGVMFVPSGLAYFSGVSTGSSYDNLIFKFELLQSEVVDHDNDGIPSYVEDLNDNLDVTDDDSDDDQLFDFIDVDDDGDGVLTLYELIPNEREFHEDDVEPILNINEFERSRTEPDIDGNIVIKTVTIADYNNDGTPDYLDANITINYTEESNN